MEEQRQDGVVAGSFATLRRATKRRCHPDTRIDQSDRLEENDTPDAHGTVYEEITVDTVEAGTVDDQDTPDDDDTSERGGGQDQ